MTEEIETTTPPIEAHPTPLPDQLWAALRQLVQVVSAFALGKGWIDGELATLITGLLGIVAPIIVGQLKTRRRAKELTTVAASPLVPENIARLRG